ncbi:hypothetical protein C8A00DRAFT_14291 [Chaetomidium leptoderma]|uniref:HNH nuclease domain-containing protein n=1 Tax=Chaetomidium leptoderma TaxID=669021 RepID=A0AAN6VNU0_9PEZI|nr:hypothetical protein C8A00DRAFT_14291 [Chaetomidium leptoderma]
MDPDLADFQRAVAADRETVLRFLRDIPPTAEPVHDYITDLDERCALFGEMQQLHRDLGVPMPNAATLGFFMVAPTSGIREHLAIVRNTPPPYMVQMLDLRNLQAPAAMSSYFPTNRSSISQQPVPMSPLTAMLGNQGDAARSKAAALNAKERDGNVCLLSGTSDPEAAHIFPFATSESKQFNHLNALLQSFWGINKALAWRSLYENPAITQSLVNYLSLGHQLHFWFDKARFAFKPLSQTPITITLQFHWLRRTNLLTTTTIDASGETLLELTGLRIPPATWGSCLAHRASGVPIRTGQTFVICAKNPNHLPSFELLELQWNLLRVAAICGAADVTDEPDSDVDDDEELYLVTSEEATARQSEAASPPELPITERTLPDRTPDAGESRSG